MMSEQDAFRWADEVIDAEYDRETLRKRIAVTLMDATQQIHARHGAEVRGNRDGGKPQRQHWTP